MVFIYFISLFLLPFALVPILATSPIFRLETVSALRKHWQKYDNKFIALKVYYLDKAGFNHRIYFPLACYAVYGALDFLDLPSRFAGLGSLNGWGIVNNSQDLILYLTFLAIVTYTLETYKLRDETYRVADATKKQADLSLAPFITVGWDERNTNFSNHLYVKNMGKGIALEVRIEREPKIASIGYQVVEYKFKIITSISPEDRNGVSVPYTDEWKPVSGERSIPTELPYGTLMSPDYDYHLVVKYKDITGGQYRTKVKSGRRYNQNFKIIGYMTPFSEYHNAES